jgi:serine/threonine protein kinase/Tfp pilus assembly protein PilF
MTLASGAHLSRYEIRSKLGAGGMGEVYLAWDEQLERTVALKILFETIASDHQRMSRFIREARAASALNHPNILTIYEIGETDGTHFIATEFIDGVNLRERVRGAHVGAGEALEVAIQAASALAAAHAAGIVHRDIKPDNIMLRRDGYVKVLDFGLAKLAERDDESQASPDSAAATIFNTDPGTVMGTAQYMSPEQARGLDVDARTDVWSLGCVLYELLTGRAPFAGRSAADLFVQILEKEPPPLELTAAGGASELAWMIQKSLRKKREDRYQSATEMLSDLQRLKRWIEFETELEFTVKSSERIPVAVESKLYDSQQKTKELSIKETTREASPTPAKAKTQPPRTRRMPRKKSINFIAVLPLDNTTADPHTEYLSDGITESIINSLSQLPGLRVMARSTVFRYKGRDVDPLEIGNELGVHAIVMGRVLQRGDKLNIQAELVDARDGSQLWGEQYNRDFSDLISVQEEISREITEKLRLRLSAEDKRRLAKRYTENTDAYQLYLRGRFYWNKRTADGFKRGMDYFQQAIETDPSYALAYAGLADCYNLLSIFSVLPPGEAIPKARATVLKALEIDDALPEAHASLAHIGMFDWNWQEAEREYRRAIELNPNFAMAHHWYAIYLMAMGRFPESLRELQLAAELDPLSLIISTSIGWHHYLVRDFDRAIEQINRTLEMDSNFYSARHVLGRAYEKKRMYEEALTEFQKASALYDQNTTILAEFGYTYAVSGQTEEARRVLKELMEPSKKYVSSFDIATIHTGLGEREEAFYWLEKAYEEHSGLLVYLKVDPIFDPIRPDPRFASLVRRIGLAS